MTIADAAEARARANVYAFLASLFSVPPTHETVRAVREMADDLALEPPEPAPLEALQREYMDLFVVPNPRYVAPYESVFCDRWMPAMADDCATPTATRDATKGLLMGESSLAVRQCYEDAGAVAEEGLPDHVAVELRFMAWLWEQQAVPHSGAPDEALRIRETFRAEHLARWIPLLRERVVQQERLGFYAAALRVAEAVLQSDSA